VRAIWDFAPEPTNDTTRLARPFSLPAYKQTPDFLAEAAVRTGPLIRRGRRSRSLDWVFCAYPRHRFNGSSRGRPPITQPRFSSIGPSIRFVWTSTGGLRFLGRSSSHRFNLIANSMRETRKDIAAKQSSDKRIMICQCLRLLQPARDRRREGGVRACCLHTRQVCSPCVPQGSIASRWCSARWSVALPLAKVACADEADAWRGFQGVLVRFGRIGTESVRRLQDGFPQQLCTLWRIG
jgi:hypothetical protein